MSYNFSTKLERKDNGIKFENAISFFKELEKNKITAGIHKDKGALTLKKAVHTEFGTTMFPEGWKTPFGKVYVVPPRPVTRMYLYPEMKEEISETYKNSVDEEMATKIKNPKQNVRRVQESIGEVCVKLQQEKIAYGGFSQSVNDTRVDPEHNGERTIQYKGFDHPWYQTGKTMDAIDYKIEKRDK